MAQQEFRYKDDRPLHTSHDECQAYDTLLPLWGHESFSQLITTKIKRLQNTNGTAVCILDLGCGSKAQALTDISRIWEHDVRLFGVSADMTTEKQEQLLEKYNLHVQKGDIQNVHLLYPENSMDIITSVEAFEYLPDPYLTLIAVNTLLKPDGVALINNVPISKAIPEFRHDGEKGNRFLKALEAKNIHVYMNSSDYDSPAFVECDLAFTKQPNLTLPLTYKDITRDVIGIGVKEFTFDRVHYTFVEPK